MNLFFAFTWNDLLPLLILKGPIVVALIAWIGLVLVNRRIREEAEEEAPLMPESSDSGTPPDGART